MDEILIRPCFICTWYGCSQEKHDVDEKTLAFIRKAREVHGWKYGYEKVKYVKMKDVAVIVCETHGEFSTICMNHTGKKKRGCKLCNKNLCEICNKNARYNYELQEQGIRCKKHSLPGMIDISGNVHCEKLFIKRIEIMGGKVIGKYQGSVKPVDCKCPKGHCCKTIPISVKQGCNMCIICERKDSETAKTNFYARILELGGKVLGEYVDSNTPVSCLCKNGHECNPAPASIQQGHGMCRICTGQDPETAKTNFYARILELGGKVLGEYVNSNTPVSCLCKNGHECNPRPSSVRKRGMCTFCSGRDSLIASQKFYDKIKQFGGIIMGKYINTDTPVECVCKNGHRCTPIPHSIQQGHGMCRICTGRDPETAKTNFYARILELGGKVLGEYVDSNTPVSCLCKNGHECNPRPSSAKKQGICRICTGQDPETAKTNFYARILELGGKVLGEYVNSNTPVSCLCKNGHECNPRPNTIRCGQGMCRICTGQDPETAKTNFYARILELGGKVLGEYVNSSTRILCVCSQGHECFVSPNSVQQGVGMCGVCSGKDKISAEKQFIQIVDNLGGKVLGKYINTDTPVECICKNGHICKPRPHHLKRGIVLCVKCLLCPSCGLWRTRGFLCSYCKPYTHNKLFAKTKEMAVVRFLKDRLPDEEFIHNRSVGRDCTGGHLFPDIRFDRIFYNLIVEVDERKHSGSGYECDERRMYDIIAKIWTPCIFIRYNPDAKDSCREVLLKKVQEYLELDEEGDSYPWDEYGFKVEYLFY